MLADFKTSISRSSLLTIAAGLAVGLAAFTLASAVVTYLIGPLIAVFIGEVPFAVNNFTIHGSEFRYGAVIEATITLALLAVMAFLVIPRDRSGGTGDGALARTRTCPECTSSISAAAKRCPHCTAIVPAPQ